MKKKSKFIKMEVTSDEEELLHAIRNWVRSYPNGKPELLWYVQELFDKMIDVPKETYEFPLS